ncbi:MAG: hypothetical protein HYZ28_27985 [Myxococcales bacterium]|nr:hypothetical protein [Myxococcales bacterium]
MSVRSVSLPPWGFSQRLADTGGRIPFSSVDTNRSGRISRDEVVNAVRLNFPGLTDLESSAIGQKAFDASTRGTYVDAKSWPQAERVILSEASTTLTDKAAEAPGGWAARQQVRTGERPPPVVAPQAPYYQPRNDYSTTGYYPYQQPVQDALAAETGRAAGRTLLGGLKMIPVVGNILNGIDFIRDLGKAGATWLDPTRSFGEKLKAGTDLLFHGAGMLVPQVGGAYDMAQGVARMGAAAAARSQLNQLPPFQPDFGAYPPAYPMQYAPPAMGPGYAPPLYGPPAYDPLGTQQYGAPLYGRQAYGPDYAPPLYGPQAYPPAEDQVAKKAVTGGARAVVGALKMIPVVGNVLNGIDFLRDIGKAAVTWLNPFKSFGEKMKVGADLLAHGAGVFVPQIGGVYDMVQGTARVGKAFSEHVEQSRWALPAYRFDNGGYPPVYPMQYAY